EHPELVLLLDGCHPGEGGAVVAHGGVPSGPLGLPGILQDELAVLCVATLPVARQTLLDPDLRPHLVLEVVVHCRRAAGPGGGLLLVAAGNGENYPCGQDECERAGGPGHGDTRVVGGGVISTGPSPDQGAGSKAGLVHY